MKWVTKSGSKIQSKKFGQQGHTACNALLKKRPPKQGETLAAERLCHLDAGLSGNAKCEIARLILATRSLKHLAKYLESSFNV